MRIGAISIRVSLKVCEIFHIRILASEESFAIFQLFDYALLLIAIRRIERLIIAIDTATSPYTSIPIRTCEASIDRNLLNLKRELFARIVPFLFVTNSTTSIYKTLPICRTLVFFTSFTMLPICRSCTIFLASGRWFL